MANRLFKPMGGSLTQDVVLLTGKWTLGASGAISSSDLTGFSVAAVDGTGKQVITLDDAYYGLIGASLTYEDTGTFDEVESTVSEIAEETVSSDREITVQHIKVADGTAQSQTNLNGKTIRCMIWLKNSSV